MKNFYFLFFSPLNQISMYRETQESHPYKFSFIGPEAVAGWILGLTFCLSFHLFFSVQKLILEIGTLLFLKVSMVLGTRVRLFVTEPDFFGKILFGEEDQKWSKKTLKPAFRAFLLDCIFRVDWNWCEIKVLMLL